ncbi:MAG: hypothetical protein ABL929_04045 [Ferruginibacter sp.]|nr:hypothetical protein [Ferruginibacter sp.]
MKQKSINLFLIISSLLGYLEWSGGNNIFLLKAEIEIFSKLFSNPLSVLHPLILIPVIGQVFLTITLFQNKPSKGLTYIGIGCIILLFLLMLFIGISTKNYKILLSTIPFLFFSVMAFLQFKKTP